MGTYWSFIANYGDLWIIMVIYGDYQVYNRDQSTWCEKAFDDFVWKRCGYFFLWGGLHVGETDVCVEKDLGKIAELFELLKGRFGMGTDHARNQYFEFSRRCNCLISKTTCWGSSGLCYYLYHLWLKHIETCCVPLASIPIPFFEWIQHESLLSLVKIRNMFIVHYGYG